MSGFIVFRINLRTDEREPVRAYANAEAAEARAQFANELAAACGMTHLLYRAIWQ